MLSFGQHFFYAPIPCQSISTVSRYYYAERPVFKAFQEKGIINVLKEYCDNTQQSELFKKLTEDHYAVGFPGCSLCDRLSRENILSHINNYLMEQIHEQA